jgi:hypothetical protein
MKLSDLSDNNRRILCALKEIHYGSRSHIADVAGLLPHQVSSGLNRLEGLGFIDRPEAPGAGWTMSGTGYTLFGLQPPVVEPEPERTEASWVDELPTSKPKPKPEPEPEPEPVSPAKSAEIMESMEIELALEEVRGLLRIPAIPARSARVYREILSALPPVLVEALAPITVMVDGHG